MSQVCTVCGGDVAGTFICTRCTRQTRQNLEGLPEHALQLHVALQRMTRMGAVNDGGKASDPALSWQGVGDQFVYDNVKDGVFYAGVEKYLKDHPIMRPYGKLAGDLLRETRLLLTRWSTTDETRDLPVNRSIPNLSAFILRHLGDLARMETIGQLVTGLKDLDQRITTAIDLPADRLRFVAGVCPEDVDNRPCVGVVMVTIPERDDTRRPQMACTRCKTVWFAEQWHRVGARMIRRRHAMDEGIYDVATA